MPEIGIKPKKKKKRHQVLLGSRWRYTANHRESSASETKKQKILHILLLLLC